MIKTVSILKIFKYFKIGTYFLNWATEALVRDGSFAGGVLHKGGVCTCDATLISEGNGIPGGERGTSDEIGSCSGGVGGKTIVGGDRAQVLGVEGAVGGGLWGETSSATRTGLPLDSLRKYNVAVRLSSAVCLYYQYNQD